MQLHNLRRSKKSIRKSRFLTQGVSMFYVGFVIGNVIGVVATLLVSRNNKVKAGALAERLNSKIEELEAKLVESGKMLEAKAKSAIKK
jgi:ABC-type lipoprotein release transport system permease subunit